MQEKPTGTVQRQADIYIKGMSGIKPIIPIRLDLLKEEARKFIAKGPFSYITGGSGRENTLNKNKQEFQKWVIVPRILTDVSNRTTGIQFLGEEHEYPFMLAPVGALDLANKAAEPAVGRAAAAEDIAMAFSSQASTPMEEVAAAMGNSKRWYQLYWSKSEEFNHSLIRRAEASGCSALIITVDVTVGGWRTQDLNLAYLPFESCSGIAQYISDPVFQRMVDESIKSGEKGPMPKINLSLLKFVINLARGYPGNFFKNLLSLRPVKALGVFTKIFSQPALSWEDISGLRKVTKLPIIVKGILHPDDAKLALKHGVDAIVVSNHGGRQLSGCIPTLEALPSIVDAVGGKLPILFDSGIRGGADIFKAIALGANAVLIGRPYVYALAIAGEKGVQELIQNLKAEFEITMALSGCKNISEITKDKIKRLD